MKKWHRAALLWALVLAGAIVADHSLQRPWWQHTWTQSVGVVMCCFGMGVIIMALFWLAVLFVSKGK